MGLSRRCFLRTASASALLYPFRRLHALPHPGARSKAFRIVAGVDTIRIMAAAQKYVSEAPVTITAFPAPNGPGGLHDFYSQADYFGRTPRTRTARTLTATARATRQTSTPIAA